MMNIKSFIVFLLLSLCSFAALAMPSVGEVENAISSGDYPKARTLLKEVLKAHPDSKVANQYMLEIIKIEYARTLKPSVEYKLYENKIQLIDKSIRLKAYAAELKQKEEKHKLEEIQNAKTRETILKWFMCIFVLAVFGFLFFYFVLPKVREHRKISKERKRVMAWKGKVYADLIDINHLIQEHKVMNTIQYDELSSKYKGHVDAIEADNLDALECVDNDDFNEIAINRHIYNAKKLLRDIGWME